jgi:hypothetical protein
MKTYDRVGRESGNFPSTEKDEKEFQEYKRRTKEHLERDIKENQKSIKEDRKLLELIGKRNR